MTADRAALLQRIHPRWRDFQPRWHEEVCPFSRTAKYDRGRVSCGYVLVPENRRDPGSRLIRIAITKVKSIARGQPPAGAIALLAGGPGVAPAESAAGYAPERNPRQRALLKLGDLYAVDQRGTGSSEAPLCRGLSGLNDVPLSLEHWQAYAAKMATCLEEGRSRGIDPDAYTTWDNALDFRDIRRALGLQQWNIFGVSYGTELGQMILRIDGDGIRAAILDSVVAPKTDDGMRRVHSAGFLAALRKLNEACADDKACAGRYGDLEALARKAVESYDAAPYTIEGLDREVYKDGKLVVNGPMVALALFQAFYESRAYAALPALLEALATRQADASLATYVEVLSPPIDYQFGRGMGLVAECAGSTLPLPDAIREQVRREPFWSNALLEQRWEELCARSSRPPADPLDAWTPLVTDRPVLLLSGALDPITPPWEARAVKGHLPQAIHVLAPWVGHQVARSADCVGVTIVSAFLKDPASPPDTSCVAQIEPPQFVTSYKKTGGPITLMREVTKGGATGALVWFGASLAILILALVCFALGLIARWIDGRAVVPAGGARRAAIAGAALSIAGAVLLGWAVMTTLESHPVLAPLGLAGPARPGLWLILLGAVTGLVAILLAIRSAIRTRLPVGTLAAVILSGGAGLALASFIWVHDFM